MQRTIAVVGAGFSGATTAVQLVRRAPPGTRVVLINESGRMARGLAYGTQSRAHVLNVPAGNMSALVDDPDNFLRFCRWSDPRVQADSFVPRPLYGTYLESLLSAAECHASGRPGLTRVVGRVVAIVPPERSLGGRLQLRLQDADAIEADEVVLAFGHFPPRCPLRDADRLAAGDAYVADPWRAQALDRVEAEDGVLLVGSGLTSMDVALALSRAGHRGAIHGVSRHGLAPRPHRPAAPPADRPDGATLAASLPTDLRGAVAAMRAEADRRRALGGDWRDLLNALRPHTPRLWAALSSQDRARFLRHVRPCWEVLRHRCAPEAHAEYEGLAAEGRLVRTAGRVASVTPAGRGLAVVLQPRGGGAPTTVHVHHIVNCTGPTSRLAGSGSMLIEQLLADGLVSADPLDLGLRVDDQYRSLRPDGTAVPWLRYVGPLLKAQHWEATAVPELRVHAERLACLLADAVSAAAIDRSTAPAA